MSDIKTDDQNNTPTSETQMHELLALFEIGKAVNSTIDLDEVLDIILRETLQLFGGEAGSIMLADRDGDLLIRAARGLSQEIMRKTRVKPGEGIAGWVYENGEALILDGKVSDDRFTNLVERKEEINTSIASPLKFLGETLGVLTVRRSGLVRYTEHERELITMICDQAAIAIENAAQFVKEMERTEQLRQLNQELSLEKLKIETILESMADGVIVLDTTGCITLINRAGGRLLNKSEIELLGKHFDTLFPEQCFFDDIRDTLLQQEHRYVKDIAMNRGGGECFYRVIAGGMRAGGKRPEGFVLVIQNITELKRLDKMKSEFVSMVSHELRTPLTSISGFTDLLLLREFPKDRRDHFLEIIQQNTSRLSRLIENLLDLSKLESGQVTFHREPIEITGLIPELLASFENQYPKHQIIFQAEGDVPVLMLDRDMFANVIINLVSNAVKYSPSGGEVKVLAKKEEENVKLTVKDQGMGIAPDMMEKVFEKFFRVDSALTRETSGTGLGLATTKYIVEGFGGKIWVESELGKGSEFIFTLPLDS